jgi:hypothetical protein
VQVALVIWELGKCYFILKHSATETSGTQTFSDHRPLGSINPVPPALSYKKHSSDQRFAQPTKEDNKIKIPHLVNYFTVSKFVM